MTLIDHIMSNKMKLLFLLITSIMVASCSSLSDRSSADMDHEVGWLHGNCLAIKNANVPYGHRLTLVHLDDQNIVEESTIGENATDSKECYPLSDDRVGVNKDAGYYFYTIKPKTYANLAIGLLSTDHISPSESKFSYCRTTEGINFFISRGNSKIWDAYYYLGYDSEPTCPSE